MKDLPDDMRRDKALMADLGTYWYTDQALSKFVSEIQTAYPDSLIIVTGDHSRRIIPFGSSLYPGAESTIGRNIAHRLPCIIGNLLLNYLVSCILAVI